MEGKINAGKKVITEKLDLPKEIFLDMPKIVLVGKQEITIENHKGILVFEKNLIKVNSKIGTVNIYGQGFEIVYISSLTITISGKFESVRYEEVEK